MRRLSSVPRIAVLVSILLHAVVAALFLFGPAGLVRNPAPKELGTIELVMVQQQGTKPSRPPAATTPAPPDPVPPDLTPPNPTPPRPAAAPTSSASPPPVASDAKTDLAMPPPQQPAETKPTQAQTTQPPPQPPAQQQETFEGKGPVFDFSGSDSDYDAIAFGNRVIPAARDSRFRNNPPRYPREAELRHEHGTVVVLIHVSAEGTASGVDVTESSGVAALDDAAVAAARTWHFHPAMQDGEAVPFDLPFRFVFEAN